MASSVRRVNFGMGGVYPDRSQPSDSTDSARISIRPESPRRIARIRRKAGGAPSINGLMVAARETRAGPPAGRRRCVAQVAREAAE